MGHLFASDGPERLPEIIVFAAQQPIIYFMNPRQAFCNRVTNCLLGLAKSRASDDRWPYQNLAGRPRDPLGSISHPPAAQLARVVGSQAQRSLPGMGMWRHGARYARLLDPKTRLP